MGSAAETVIRDLTVSRYLALTAITICFYDWFVVFNDEVELLGSTRFSKGKILYYFTRIVTPIGLILGVFHIVDIRPSLNHKFCLAFIWVSPILEVLSIFASYWLLTLRIIALYKSRPIVIYLLYTTLFATYLTSLGLLVHALRQFSATVAYLPSVNLCLPSGRISSLQGVFEAPLVFEVLLFGLTAWHAWKRCQERRVSGVHVRMVPVLRVMYRDGIFYFCVLFAVRVWNIVIYATLPAQEAYMGVYIMWSLITTLACRIYLNIVREAERKQVSTRGRHSMSSDSAHIPTFYNNNTTFSDRLSRSTTSHGRACSH